MQIYAAKPLVEQLRKEHQAAVRILVAKGVTPCLAVVLVGSDPASEVYVDRKKKEAERLGIKSLTCHFEESVDPKVVEAKIAELNKDTSVHGILIQRPLPKSFDESKVLFWIHPHKDVDGFHPENVGKLHLSMTSFKPCTPLGIIKLLDYYQIPLEGLRVCVVGRSAIVGRPLASLLTARNSTVTLAHSKTRGLSEITQACDLVVAAIGQKKFFKKSDFKKGAIVVDVGIHRTDQGLCGDVDPEGQEGHLKGITPVPGGVGPMTIQMLMANTIKSAQYSLKGKTT
jgi:methylenetetrahydrofolate dehydrogenase (NADP+)/methenyltetrahydrofolate cyclohydrolase